MFPSNVSYLSLFQNIALQASLTPKQAIKKFPKGIPYDYSCPSTKDVLTGRLCYHCGLYFGSIKSNVNHSSYCRAKAEASTAAVTRKVRPQRVAARRQKELLCALMMLILILMTTRLTSQRSPPKVERL